MQSVYCVDMQTNNLTSAALEILAGIPTEKQAAAVQKANEMAKASGLTGVSGTLMKIAASKI